jgi:AcrR family transcriptional regulator
MPRKATQQKASSLRAEPIVDIPTTVKNPQRVAHRRTELIEVATKMFLERGFHNTSIRDIVRACSFNIASLYMYVSSKEDILYLVAQDLMNTIASELSETVLVPDSPKRSLEIGFASYCRIADRLRRPIRLLYREVAFLPPERRAKVLGTVSDVISYFEKIVRQGIEMGVFRDVTPRLAALEHDRTAYARGAPDHRARRLHQISAGDDLRGAARKRLQQGSPKGKILARIAPAGALIERNPRPKPEISVIRGRWTRVRDRCRVPVQRTVR